MIQLQNISLQYEKRYYIKNFSFDFENNKKYVISGESGSGKSTIFSIILGFTDFIGEVIYNSKSNNFCKIRENCGYLTQNYNINFESANEILDLYKEFNKSFDNDKFYSLFNLFKLSKEYANKPFNNISGGEKQRILLALVLSTDKEFYLLDEPTSGLDANLEDIIIDYLNNIEQTVIVVSHSTKIIDKFINLNSKSFICKN